MQLTRCSPSPAPLPPIYANKLYYMKLPPSQRLFLVHLKLPTSHIPGARRTMSGAKATSVSHQTTSHPRCLPICNPLFALFRYVVAFCMYLIIPPADVKSARFPTTSEQSGRARKCEVLTRRSLAWIRFWRARLGIGMAHGSLGGDGNQLRFVQ
jgi:hypothetical protein